MTKLLTVTEVAEWLSVSPKTVYRWVHEEHVPHLKLGRVVRFDQKDIERWVKTKRTQPTKHNRPILAIER